MHVPPPVVTAVTEDGLDASNAGIVSVKVVDAVNGPMLVTVRRYCIVAAPGTVICAVVVTPDVPLRCDLVA